LQLSHDAKNMVFALEIVEEGPFAYVCAFRDVLDGDILESAIGEELKRGPKQTQPGFRSTALAAAHCRSFCPGSPGESPRQRIVMPIVTVPHMRFKSMYDYQSTLYHQSRPLSRALAMFLHQLSIRAQRVPMAQVTDQAQLNADLSAQQGGKSGSFPHFAG
jgi:hypothetical protein